MKLLLLTTFTVLLSHAAFAQIEIKTEYIGRSDYKNIDNEKTGGKGDARVVSGMARIPVYMHMNENNRPTAWAIGAGASYTNFQNKDMPEELCPSEILNGQLTLMHLRPVWEKWSLLAAVGAGFYTAHADMSDITMKNILGSGGAIFIWHLRPNLDVGAGLAVNTSFGYPMVFPAFYVNWRLEGRYEVDAQMMDAFELSGGIKFNDNFKLKAVFSMSGSLALEKINGKDMMFSHQYMTAGIRPELRLGQFSVPVMLGISAERAAYYEERSLKAMFKAMGREHDPHFRAAPYASVALRYGF